MNENDIIQKITENEQRSKSNTKRIDKLEDDQRETRELISVMKQFQTEQAHMKSDISDIKTDLREIKGRPSRRWDAVITAIIGAVVGVLIGFLTKGV